MSWSLKDGYRWRWWPEIVLKVGSIINDDDDDGRFFVVRRSVGRKSLLGAACPLMTDESNSGFTYSWAGGVVESLIAAGRCLIGRLLSLYDYNYVIYNK